MKYTVGIDWATTEHEFCVLDPEARIVKAGTFRHRGEDLNGFATELLKLAKDRSVEILVAIERPDGAVIETLIEKAIPVFSINPKQLDRFRDRHTVSGSKDDRKDAFVLADSLRTDEKLYRRVEISSPLIIQLRDATRLREDLNEQLGQAANRLREQLIRYYPQALELGGADEAWFWALLEKAPTPQDARRLQKGQVAALLKHHRIRRLNAAKVIDTLRATPVTVAPGVTEGASLRVRSLLRQLSSLRQELRTCMSAVESLIETLSTPVERQPAEASQNAAEVSDKGESSEGQKSEHRDAEVIRSLPGVGINVFATMLAEAWQALRDRDYTGLRLRCGVAPVTFQTGKQRQRGDRQGKQRGPKPVVAMRMACNARLRNAIFHMANTAARVDPHWSQHYKDARSRGLTHGAATRLVGDRMLCTLVSMLRNGEEYDPTRWSQKARAA